MNIFYSFFVSVFFLTFRICQTEWTHQFKGRYFYVNQFAVEIIGTNVEADKIATKYGFVNSGNVLRNYYGFLHPGLRKRSLRKSGHLLNLLMKDPQVRWVEQQISVRMTTRSIGSMSLNDPYWGEMWYMNPNPSHPEKHMNVMEAWKLNITGSGVVVAVLDNGFQINNTDLKDNYDPEASYNFQHDTFDPTPRYDVKYAKNSHGTRCAGQIGAKANNSFCAVGVAYGVKIGGLKIFDESKTDIIEARALRYKRQYVDIYSNSWGPTDDGRTLAGPRKLGSIALQEGTEQGRHGRGSIFVWAAGNGGNISDDCNGDGYANSIYTIAITGVGRYGGIPEVNENCAAALAATPTREKPSEIAVFTTDPYNEGCTNDFSGTSASTAFAAGVCALALQANPKLTWRDLQHIIVRTANSTGLRANDWEENKDGKKSSHYFGFGVMDAGAMVKLAKQWNTVPRYKHCSVHGDNSVDITNARPGKSVIDASSCGSDSVTDVKYVEAVQARVTLSLSFTAERSKIKIVLTSPGGTESILLRKRPLDYSRSNIDDWPFMTTHNWGEKSEGKWTLKIINDSPGTVTLNRWTLVLHGTTEYVGKFGGPPTKTNTPDKSQKQSPFCCSWSYNNLCQGIVNSFLSWQ